MSEWPEMYTNIIIIFFAGPVCTQKCQGCLRNKKINNKCTILCLYILCVRESYHKLHQYYQRITNNSFKTHNFSKMTKKIPNRLCRTLNFFTSRQAGFISSVHQGIVRVVSISIWFCSENRKFDMRGSRMFVYSVPASCRSGDYLVVYCSRKKCRGKLPRDWKLQQNRNSLL